MKALKVTLASIFLVLVVLLLINRCKGPQYTDRPEDIGHDGRFKVALRWDFPGDVDLHVGEPSGNRICFQSPRNSFTGGELDIDNQQGGPATFEHIYWENPPAGDYQIQLCYYAPVGGHLTGGDCKVYVYVDNQLKNEFTVKLVRPSAATVIPVTTVHID